MHIDKHIWYIIVPIIIGIIIFFGVYANMYGYITIESGEQIAVSINDGKKFIEYTDTPLKVPVGKNTIFIKSTNPKHQIYIDVVEIEYKKTVNMKPMFLVNPNMVKTDLNKSIFVYKDQKATDYDDNMINNLSSTIGVTPDFDRLIGKIKYIHNIDMDNFYIVTKTSEYLILYLYNKANNKFTNITGYIQNIAFMKDIYMFSIKNNNTYEVYLNKNNKIKNVITLNSVPIFSINGTSALIILPNTNIKSQQVYTVDIENETINDKYDIFDFYINEIKNSQDGFLVKGKKDNESYISYIDTDLKNKISMYYDAYIPLTEYFNQNIYFIDYHNTNIAFYVYNNQLETPKIWAEITDTSLLLDKIYISPEDKQMYLSDNNNETIYMVDLTE